MSHSRISLQDRDYLNTMRGISITRVVLVHLGLSWFFTPYSQFIHVLLPVLFFVSGAVLFFSFHRAPSAAEYLTRRSIAIYIPYLLLILLTFPVFWLFNGTIPPLNTENIFQWLTINPVAVDKTMPFPLHQTWYLHTLVFIIFISPLFFKPGKNNPLFLCIPILISLLVSIAQLFIDIGHNLYLLDHNIYQPLANMGFFFFGALFYSNKQFFTKKMTYALALLSLLTGTVTGMFFTSDINMYHHTYAPDMYYASLSYFSIFAFLILQPLIEKTTLKASVLKWFFNFMSRHSFSVFLLHSLVLIKIHTWLNLANVAQSPALAAIKIALVMFITCLLAIPFSRLSNWTINLIEERITRQDDYAGYATSKK